MSANASGTSADATDLNRTTDGTIIPQRVTAQVEAKETIVFLIGMRINKPWKIHKWLPVARAMGRMINELYSAGDMGFRHVESWFGRTTIMIQYWDSFEALESYATRNSAQHLPAWKAFNTAVASNGDVGIWHETYLVKAGEYESVYSGMPRFGLGSAGTLTDASGRKESARGRLGEVD